MMLGVHWQKIADNMTLIYGCRVFIILTMVYVLATAFANVPQPLTSFAKIWKKEYDYA